MCHSVFLVALRYTSASLLWHYASRLTWHYASFTPAGMAFRANSTPLVGPGGVLIEQTRPIVRAPRISVDGSPAAGRRRVTAKPAPLPAPLGNNADLTTPPPSYGLSVLPPATTTKAWWLRSYGRDILQKSGVSVRMRWCGSRIARGKDGVGVYARPDRAYGRLHGVCVCGQSLACPVCAPRIAAFRAAEVSQCFERAKALGFEARLETFTIPHALGTSLDVEIECFAAAWKKLQDGKAATRARKHCLGNHTGREVTWGAANGWHYHHHRCRYDRPGTYDPERMRYYWLAALREVGRYKAGADEHAFDCGIVGDAVHAAYVGKLASAVEAQARAIGSEIASAATKGKNLSSLLLAAAIGDEVAGRVWLAGVHAVTTRKVSSVRWSRGLRGKVGMAVEKSDEQVAIEESLPSDIFLGALTAMQWRGVLLHRAEFALCCAANRGVDSVNSFLSGLQLGQLNDDPRPGVVVPLEADNVYQRRDCDNFPRAVRPVLPAWIQKGELKTC